MSDEWTNWPLRRRLKVKARERARRRFWDRHDKRTYECASCGCGYDGAGREWEVHHKDRDALNAHIFNLVALCHTCHRHAHSSVARKIALDEWKEGFLGLGDAGEKNIAAEDSSEREQSTLEEWLGGGVPA